MWFNVRMDKWKEMSVNYSNKHGELKGGEVQKIAIEIDGTFLEKYPTYMQ